MPRDNRAWNFGEAAILSLTVAAPGVNLAEGRGGGVRGFHPMPPFLSGLLRHFELASALRRAMLRFRWEYGRPRTTAARAESLLIRIVSTCEERSPAAYALSYMLHEGIAGSDSNRWQPSGSPHSRLNGASAVSAAGFLIVMASV